MAFETRSAEQRLRCAHSAIGSTDRLKRAPCRDGGVKELLSGAQYAQPLVSPDCRFVVAAKSSHGWANPNVVIRLDLDSGKEFTVDLPAADDFSPVAYVHAHKKFLLRRAKDNPEDSDDQAPVGPAVPEYSLLDAASGATEIVQGEFRPFLQQSWRPLQPAAAPDVFWAAIERDDNSTQVGKYDSKAFAFQAAAAFPEVSFDSMAMWVDEEEAAAYVAIQGDVLRLPLRR